MVTEIAWRPPQQRGIPSHLSHPLQTQYHIFPNNDQATIRIALKAGLVILQQNPPLRRGHDKEQLMPHFLCQV